MAKRFATVKELREHADKKHGNALRAVITRIDELIRHAEQFKTKLTAPAPASLRLVDQERFKDHQKACLKNLAAVDVCIAKLRARLKDAVVQLKP
ncbi:hypothetical protein [Limnoglobus roseus]|uniref:C2H2-type domain-containing protein n=1 Tax=Limnoglobus roseus TaxID=2598579 RepID=A0A5C1APV6_9BACT|nr:hypothetical protein [Limnoglobus roseus]QEL18898.1 hypothetical protein PX52LOC_05945 [Limnoglobus roseus]